jgi:hypothetical protein
VYPCGNVRFTPKSGHSASIFVPLHSLARPFKPLPDISSVRWRPAVLASIAKALVLTAEALLAQQGSLLDAQVLTRTPMPGWSIK